MPKKCKDSFFTWTNVQFWSSFFHRLRGPERGWWEITGPLKHLYMIINLIIINCNNSSQKRKEKKWHDKGITNNQPRGDPSRVEERGRITVLYNLTKGFFPGPVSLKAYPVQIYTDCTHFFLIEFSVKINPVSHWWLIETKSTNISIDPQGKLNSSTWKQTNKQQARENLAKPKSQEVKQKQDRLWDL